MNEPHEQGVAPSSAPSHAPMPVRELVKRSTGENPGQPLSSEIITLCAPTLSFQREGHTEARQGFV